MIRRVAFALATLLFLGACRTLMEPEIKPSRSAEQEWDDLLKRVVSDDGYVDYDLLENHRDVLERYVAWLGVDRPNAKPSYPRMGFWLNAYNALVLYQVIERGQPESVMDVGRGPAGAGFFMFTAFEVEQDRVSLWEIEHERLRMKTMDFRIHGAMNCASRSCPPLRNETFKPGQVVAQVNDQMRLWVNDPERGIRVEDGQLVMNPIFEWFREDFEFWTGGKTVCRLAARYAEQPLRKELLFYERVGCPFTTFEYDWRLNDVRAVRADE